MGYMRTPRMAWSGHAYSVVCRIFGYRMEMGRGCTMSFYSQCVAYNDSTKYNQHFRENPHMCVKYARPVSLACSLLLLGPDNLNHNVREQRLTSDTLSDAVANVCLVAARTHGISRVHS